jgi:FkbM family methyltransferase
MQKSLLGGDSTIKSIKEKKYEPFYHDLYNDLFYKNVIFPNKKNGYFVEVGALDGFLMSQSFIFEKQLDWNGIVVEPNPIWKDGLNLHRNCDVSTKAISNKRGKMIFECRQIPSFSGLKMSTNESRTSDVINEFEIETITLNDLFDEFNAPEILDWVSIDTEGAEIDILKQFFLENKKYKINLLSFETLNQTQSDEIMYKQPYLEIKNPYLDFLKISNLGLLKFNPLTGEMFKSPYTEWVYEGDFISNEIKAVNFEKYYIHIDYLKDNLHLKKYLIN